MATAEKKKRAKAGFLTKILILALMAALGLQLVHLHDQVQDAEAQKQQLAAQVADQQRQNDELQEGIDQAGSEEEMMKLAREELGLVAPGERVFYDVSN